MSPSDPVKVFKLTKGERPANFASVVPDAVVPLPGGREFLHPRPT